MFLLSRSVMTLLLCQMVTRTKKIFVGGLSTTTTLEEVKIYFSKFGEVSEYLVNLSIIKLWL